MLSIDATPDVKYNSARAMSKLQPYLVAALEAATDELLKQMQILVHTVTDVGATGKGAPGDPEWRNEIDRELKKLYVEVTKNAIEGAVGVSYSSGYRFVRLMLVAYGSGSRSYAPDWTPSPIMYGPEGRSVWNGSLTRHHPNQSKIKLVTILSSELWKNCKLIFHKL